MNLKEKEELISNILYKFDLLFDKEDYYNNQERVYKLNKTFTSISRAKNLSVTNFTSPEKVETKGEGMNYKANSNKNLQEVLSKLDISLENLSKILDDLLEKQGESSDHLFTSSSSEECDRNENLSTKKKRRLMKNLYNYELLLKAYFFEKSPEDATEQSLKNLKDEHVEPDKPIEPTDTLVSKSNCHTPISKMSKNDTKVAKTLNNTPVINKSFFEDEEIKKSMDRRRRSYLDGSDSNFIHLHPGNNSYLQKQRRRSHIFEGGPTISLSHSNNMKIHHSVNSFSKEVEKGEPVNFTSEFNDNNNLFNEISTFNINLNDNSIGAITSTQLKEDLTKEDSLFNKNNFNEKRTSIFRDKDNYLTNITENEEFYANLSFDGKSFSSEEEEKK